MTKTKFLLFSLLAVVALSFGAVSIFNKVWGDKPYARPWESKRPRAEAEAACRQHLQDAQTKAAAAVARRSAAFAEFIQSRKAGTKAFSEEVVSLYGKWRAVKTHLPGTDADGHKKYVAEKFSQHIFSQEDLAAAVNRAIEGSIKDVEAIENELAVALRQEILGRSLKPDEVPIAAGEFKKAVEQMVAASQWDATKAVGSLVTSEVAAQVGAQVLLRLGVSAGLLSAGAASSWASLGAGLVIGIVVDAIWQWVDDPSGDIEREMTAALDKLSLDASTAIKEEMNKVIVQRSALWNQSVTQVLP